MIELYIVLYIGLFLERCDWHYIEISNVARNISYLKGNRFRGSINQCNTAG